jgi:hypothetical protein
MKKPNVIKLLGYSKETRNSKGYESDILKSLKEERAQTTDVLDSLVKKLTEQILIAVKYYNGLGRTECMEEIPSITIGFPLYDVREVSRRIAVNLNKIKLKAKVVRNNTIYICWK